MDLIDWSFVVRNALWILGLSIVLAAWSYTSWWASTHHVRVRQALGLPMFTLPLFAGMLLFSTSLAWGATRWWERVLWIGLGIAFLAQLIVGWREERGKP